MTRALHFQHLLVKPFKKKSKQLQSKLKWIIMTKRLCDVLVLWEYKGAEENYIFIWLLLIYICCWYLHIYFVPPFYIAEVKNPFGCDQMCRNQMLRHIWSQTKQYFVCDQMWSQTKYCLRPHLTTLQPPPPKKKCWSQRGQKWSQNGCKVVIKWSSWLFGS